MLDHSIFDAFGHCSVTASGVHLYDFLGTRTRAAFKRGWDKHLVGEGKKLTLSAPQKDEHYLDWIGLLTSVDRAQGVFRMAELGAGWAPWTVRGALAARQRKEITGVELVAVEADPTHFSWILQHFRDNGLDPEAHHLLHGAVAAHPGTLKFPALENPDVNYGASIIIGDTGAPVIEVPGYTIHDVLDRFSGPVDFLHVDIQGAEYEVLPPAMGLLREQVKSIMIGTHFSDTQHDALVEAFTSEGWKNGIVLARNTRHATPWGNITTHDGFLLFDNPRFVDA